MMMGLGPPELLVILVVLCFTVFWIWMIIEAATMEAPGSQDRLIWVIVILFSHFIGAAIYFFVRRPVRRAALGH